MRLAGVSRQALWAAPIWAARVGADRREAADQDRVLAVTGLLQRVPAGVEKTAIHLRRIGDRRAVDRLRAKVLAEVRLVPDRPEVDPWQRRRLALGGVLPVVTSCDRREELTVSGRARLPREE